MLMLLSLCMALVGAESGAEGEEEEEGCRGAGQDRTLCRSWHQGQRSRRRLQRSVVQVGGGGEGPLESLSQVPLWLLRDVKAGVSGSDADEPLGWR